MAFHTGVCHAPQSQNSRAREPEQVLPSRPPICTHADLMTDMAETAFAYVKTGDCSAYSSVVLQCGISYLDDAIALRRSLHD